MKTLFLCSVRRDEGITVESAKTTVKKNGKKKLLQEQYLFEAVSYTDAEARVTAEIQPLAGDEFRITNIARLRLSGICLPDSAGKFYKVTLIVETQDAKTDRVHRNRAVTVVRASSLEKAIATTKDEWREADYELVSATETAIIDFYPEVRRTP